MIKAVFLDIDNTLLDFDAYVKNALRDGFEKYGLGAYDDHIYDVFHEINTKVWQELEQGVLTYEELLKTRWNRVFAALGISFDGCEFEKYFKGCLFDSAIVIDGAIDALAYLKERYILCAASNGPYEQQLNRLQKAGMLQYFSHLFISGKIGAAKPSEEFFSHCLRELNTNGEILPSEIMIIGDSLSSDMLGAVQNGLKSCFFDRNKSGRTNDLPIDHVISSLADIRNIL